MATSQTPKITKGITSDMLVSVYKPIGTGENSEVFAGTIADLKEVLGIEPSEAGITSITSTDGSISIDNTDASAPDLSAVKITSTDGTNTATFLSSPFGLKAEFNDADFTNPFTVFNSGGTIRMGFFDKGASGFVTPQAAAIADATDATDVITQFNTLLAAMRAYGLIAE